MGEGNLESLLKKICSRAPDILSGVRSEINQCAHTKTGPLMKKMNLVSREEYDIQIALVKQLRTQLRQLEKRLSELEENAPN